MNLRQLLTDPEIFQENRLPSHSDHTFYHGVDTSETLSLNGNWAAQIVPDLTLRTPDFFQTHQTGWNLIAVPGHLNLQGFGQPQYTNIAYPWDGQEQLTPPALPSQIPTAQMTRLFTCPDHWIGKSVRLRFDGVEPACRVWLNGTYIGYTESSFDAAEFDVSHALQAGQNVIAVEIYRWASGSWLEDQDFWRFWGIFRSITLYALPEVHLNDLQVIADMYGHLTLSGTILGIADQVSVKLLSPTQEQILHQPVIITQENKLQFHTQLDAPMLWSAESPNLYQLFISLEKNDTPIETVIQSIGFRTICIENSVILLNGKRLLLHGVNRHEFSAESGRSVTVEQMEWDAFQMKRNNINAVRTSHYPNRKEWYEICDRIGLYVIDEANLETHGSWSTVGDAPWLTRIPDDKPEWLEAVCARGQAMIAREKNHPSILFWSCGNESNAGEVIYQMSERMRRLDPTRLIHYEGISQDPRYSFGKTPFEKTSDVYSTMYAPPEKVEWILQNFTDKPYIQCEYAHAMGNSTGSLEDYIALEEKYPHCQGGFIWDWIDQQIMHNGRLAYGGDFQERVHYGDFCANGLVFADRTPTPKLSAVKIHYAPCKLKLTEKEVIIQNHHLFTDLSDFTLTIVCTANGIPFETQSYPLQGVPGQKVVVTWRCPQTFPDGEIIATANLCLKASTMWAEKGYCITYTQTILRSLAAAHSGWHIVHGGEHTGFFCSALSALFDKHSGKLISIQNSEGKEWLKAPIQPTFWRAPVSNDVASDWHHEKAQWKLASLYPKLAKMDVCETGIQYQVTCTYILPTVPSTKCILRYSFQPDAKIHLQVLCEKPDSLPNPFCFGLEFTTFPNNNTAYYYGYGPCETASDRVTGAQLGCWQTTSQLVPYMNPQDCSMHSGVRWVDCGGLRFMPSEPMEFSILPWNCHEIEQACHSYELPPSEKNVLRLLAWNCGVGGDDTWGARPRTQYQMNEKSLWFDCTICPL